MFPATRSTMEGKRWYSSNCLWATDIGFVERDCTNHNAVITRRMPTGAFHANAFLVVKQRAFLVVEIGLQVLSSHDSWDVDFK